MKPSAALLALLLAAAVTAPSPAQDTIPPARSATGGFSPDSAREADPGPLVVDEVIVVGNSKTKDFVILREMSLHRGDTVTPAALEYDRERIYSLRLFNSVDVTPVPSHPGRAKIVVEVNERWYIFPFPILGIRDHDWGKVYFGAGAVHNNFRGRNEKLFASIVLGYDPSYSLYYRNNFLDDAGTWFLDARSSYSLVRNRSPEVERLLGEYEERHFTLASSVGRRVGRHHSLWLNAGFRLVHVPTDSAASTISPRGTDRFPVGGLGYAYDTRDLAEYPSRGTMALVTFTKYGVTGADLDFHRFATDFRQFVPLPGGFTACARLFTDLAGGGRLPAFNRVYFGYGERIRGHFDTVVEGENLAGATAELHFPLLAARYLRAAFLPEGFSVWRFGVTAALFADAGTAWFRDGEFSTANLAKGYGAGLHFLLPYSGVLRIEYAFDERRNGELIVDLGATL